MSEKFLFHSPSTLRVVNTLKDVATELETHQDDFVSRLAKNYLSICSHLTNSRFLIELDNYVFTVKKHDGFAVERAIDGGIDGFGNGDTEILRLQSISMLFCLYLKEYMFRKNFDYSGLDDFYHFLLFIQSNFSEFDSRFDYIKDFYWNLSFYIVRDQFHSEHALSLAKAINSSDIDVVNHFIKTKDDAIQKITDWENSCQLKIATVEELQRKLDEQKTAFNFVGLYKGFERLKGDKTSQLEKTNREYYGLGAAMVAIPICELLWVLFHFESISAGSGALAVLGLSTVSLVVMLFYFLRVCLADVKSLKSQIMQLELRMTLCQFIQNYADTSKDLKDKNKEGFEKFESLIFSSIVSSDEKIPSTFDGMDQLTNLLKAFQGKS